MGEQRAVGGPFRGHLLRTNDVEGCVPGAWAGRSQELAALSSMGHLPKVIAAGSGGVGFGAEAGMWRMLAGCGVGGEGAGGEAMELKGLRSPLPHQRPLKPLGEGGLVTWVLLCDCEESLKYL